MYIHTPILLRSIYKCGSIGSQQNVILPLEGLKHINC